MSFEVIQDARILGNSAILIIFEFAQQIIVHEYSEAGEGAASINSVKRATTDAIEEYFKNCVHDVDG